MTYDLKYKPIEVLIFKRCCVHLKLNQSLNVLGTVVVVVVVVVVVKNEEMF